MPDQPTPPTKGATPVRSFRIPDDLWQAVTAKANDEGISVTSVIMDSLSAYVNAPTKTLADLAADLTDDKAEEMAVLLIKKLRGRK